MHARVTFDILPIWIHLGYEETINLCATVTLNKKQEQPTVDENEYYNH